MSDKIKVKICGFNLKNIINYLIEKGICVFDLKVKSKYVTFIIYLKDRFVLDKYCKIYNKKYEILKKFSISEKLKNLRLYLGGLFAIVLVFCYVWSYNFIIFDIEIYNNSNVEYDLNKVSAVLKNKKIIGLNYTEIEGVILGELNDLVGCSVEKIGGKINIVIFPEIIEDLNKETKLFSKYDSIITEIEVFNGKTNYKVGDVVKCGDLVISSQNEAVGFVRGNVYFSSSLIYNKVRQNINYTGRFLVNKTLYLFNKKLLKRENNIYFANYLTKKCDFHITENYLIPLKCESEYFFEYEIVEEIVEFETVEFELKKSLYDEVISNVPSDAKILNTYYSVVKEGDLTRLDCFVEVNVDLI